MSTVLYYDLKAISTDEDIDEKAKAFDSCVMIAANSPHIDDYWMDFYLSTIEIDRQAFLNALSLFVGAELIILSSSGESDLGSDIVNNPYFYMGDRMKEELSKEYVDCVVEIMEMTLAIKDWDVKEIYDECN